MHSTHPSRRRAMRHYVVNPVAFLFLGALLFGVALTNIPTEEVGVIGELSFACIAAVVGGYGSISLAAWLHIRRL